MAAPTCHKCSGSPQMRFVRTAEIAPMPGSKGLRGAIRRRTGARHPLMALGMKAAELAGGVANKFFVTDHYECPRCGAPGEVSRRKDG